MTTTPQTIVQEYNQGKRDFTSSILNGANLTGQNLSGAILNASQLLYAQLQYSSLIWSQLAYSNLSNANLSNANLSNAIFINSDLSNANFSNADLRNANFTGAKLTGVDFTGANLKGADFKDAKYEGVKFPEPVVQVLANGTFQVDAKSKEGVNFPNPVNAEITVRFTPSGKWSIVGAHYVTAAGWVDHGLQNQCPYPNYYLGGLVAVSNQTNNVTLMAGEKRIRMKPNETLTFKMNDVPGYYVDNQGSLTVAWEAIV